MYHIFFVYSSTHRYLGFFYVFTIVNFVAMNTGVCVCVCVCMCVYVCVSFQIMFSLDMCPGMELQDHMVALFLVF